jgi:hypothetical protein
MLFKKNKDLIDNKKKNVLNYIILDPFSMKRQKTMLEDDLLPRESSFFLNENEAFEDFDLPKNSNTGYYYWIGKDYSNGILN